MDISNRKQRRAAAKRNASESPQPSLTLTTATATLVAKLIKTAMWCQQAGRLSEAEIYYKRALAHQPHSADVHYYLGNAFAAQGRLDEAAGSYRQALTCKPDLVEALHNLGNVRMIQERFEEAASIFGQALTYRPHFADAHYNLGNALMAQGKLDEAEAAFRRALVYKPEHIEALGNLGNVLLIQDKLNEAEACFRHALANKPGVAEAHFSLGNTLAAQGKLDEAVAALRQAITLKPRYVDAIYNLGLYLRAQGKLGEAVAYFEQALTFKPDHANAHCQHIDALLTQGKLGIALNSCHRMLAHYPDLPEVHFSLGNVLAVQGKLDEAIESFQQALALNPDYFEAHSNLLMWSHYLAPYSSAGIFINAREFGQRIEKDGFLRDFGNTADPQRRLRIGYISPDFRAHPVGYFLARILEAHNRANVKVFCYSNSNIADDMTARLRAAAEGWRSITGLSDTAAAAMIRQDGIDILVDLTGHTANNRLPLFAMKPAPVQVTWLGYVGTTGLSTIDYIIADRFVVPPGEEDDFTEKVWRLPDCYLCYSPPVLNIPVGPFPALSNGFVTFGCFNNHAKISPETVAAWAAILKRVQGSRLFLKTWRLFDADCQASLLSQFASHGVEDSCLILEGRSPLVEALAAYNRVDIALDPFPFGGGTTTAETLWMGVPLVTLKGERWTGRMSQSILATLELNEWVAKDVERYIETACQMAADLPQLVGLRTDLRGRLENSTFCDGPAFTNSLEVAYRGMWTAWCEKHTAP